jgi:hypothetical protein
MGSVALTTRPPREVCDALDADDIGFDCLNSLNADRDPAVSSFVLSQRDDGAESVNA